MNVSKFLARWYNLNKRDLPWRESSDAYIIWLSEIILQQTRVSQGMPYFYKFVANYPTINDLAIADEDEILKLWQGLGYYSRARNMQATAKSIVQNHNGIFPSDYQEVRKLKGIGDYTAAAICSFAYNQPYAVVDGNVYRFLSRLMGEKTPVDSPQGKKLFAAIADSLLDKKNPGIHNQAIMEFGATVCKPAPDCSNCELTQVCVAYRENLVGQLPVKNKKAKVSKRYFNYILIRHKNDIFIKQRVTNDIWKKLYELPLIETQTHEHPDMVMESDDWKSYFKKAPVQLRSVKNYPVYKLSHQHIFARIFDVEVKGNPGAYLSGSYLKIQTRDLPEYPVPRLIEMIFTDHFS